MRPCPEHEIKEWNVGDSGVDQLTVIWRKPRDEDTVLTQAQEQMVL